MPSYKNRQCQFCKDKTGYIDYKNLGLIKKYLTQYCKIVPKYYSGNCLTHQKKLARAIKYARKLALIRYTA